MNHVCTIIVTYNGAKWIRKCLHSVESSSIKSHCIVVDNCSTDGTTNIIKAEFPNVELLLSETNLGFGKANNIAMRMALQCGFRYIYLLNQDAWIFGNTYSQLVSVMEKHPDYGIVAPVMLTGAENKVEDGFLRGCAAPDFCPALLNDFLMELPTMEIYETSFVMAAHWMIRCDALRRVGLFSPAFPHYGEDNNLVQRFQWLGFRIGICPMARSVHDREGRQKAPKQKLNSLYINNLAAWHNIIGGGKSKRLFILLNLSTKTLFLQKEGQLPK